MPGGQVRADQHQPIRAINRACKTNTDTFNLVRINSTIINQGKISFSIASITYWVLFRMSAGLVTRRDFTIPINNTCSYFGAPHINTYSVLLHKILLYP